MNPILDHSLFAGIGTAWQKAVPSKGNTRRLDRSNERLEKRWKNIFVFSDLAEIDSVSKFIENAAKLHTLRIVFTHVDQDHQDWSHIFLGVFNRFIDRVFTYSDIEEPKRIIEAHLQGRAEQSIAMATSSESSIIVRNCSGTTMIVPWDDIPALQKLSAKQQRSFELDRDGIYLHWPAQDIHLDFESFQYILNPDFKRKRDAENFTKNKNYGLAIRSFREESGILQTEIDGLTERHLRRIENGAQRATLKSLELLAKSHNIPLNEYLEAVSNRIERKKI